MGVSCESCPDEVVDLRMGRAGVERRVQAVTVLLALCLLSACPETVRAAEPASVFDWSRATQIPQSSGAGLERDLRDLARSFGTDSVPVALEGEGKPHFVSVPVERLERLCREEGCRVHAYTIPGHGSTPPSHLVLCGPCPTLEGRVMRPGFFRAGGGSAARAASSLEDFDFCGVAHVADFNGDGLTDWLLSGVSGNSFVGFEVGWPIRGGFGTKRLPGIVNVWESSGRLVLEVREPAHAPEVAIPGYDLAWTRIFEWDGRSFVDTSRSHAGYYENVYLPAQRLAIERCRRAQASGEDPHALWAGPSIQVHERLIRKALEFLATRSPARRGPDGRKVD
jgi:hypothetical protein